MTLHLTYGAMGTAFSVSLIQNLFHLSHVLLQRDLLLLFERLRGQRDEHGDHRQPEGRQGQDDVRVRFVSAVQSDDGVRRGGGGDDDGGRGRVQLDASGLHATPQCRG